MNIGTVAPYQTTSLYAKSTAVKMAITGEQVLKVAIGRDCFISDCVCIAIGPDN